MFSNFVQRTRFPRFAIPIVHLIRLKDTIFEVDNVFQNSVGSSIESDLIAPSVQVC
jgi:hypothetical protein